MCASCCLHRTLHTPNMLLLLSVFERHPAGREGINRKRDRFIGKESMQAKTGQDLLIVYAAF